MSDELNRASTAADLVSVESRLDERTRDTESRLDERIRETASRLDQQIRETASRLDQQIRETASRLDQRIHETESRLEAHISEEGRTTRRHFDIVAERMNDTVKLVAEVAAHHSTVLDDHEHRLRAIEDGH
jgi:exonuclease VII large subunit